MDRAFHGKWQFTLRSLLLVTAAVALLMVPVAWVARERRQLLMTQQEILLARQVALESVVREEQRRRRAASASTEGRPSPDAFDRPTEARERGPEATAPPTSPSGRAAQVRHESHERLGTMTHSLQATLSPAVATLASRE